MSEKLEKIIKIISKKTKGYEYPALYMLLPKGHPISAVDKVRVIIHNDKIEIFPLHKA